jgi:hypothetical protein
MDKRTRTTLILGILLILAGIYFLLVNALPGFADLINITFSWPVIVMLVGAGLLLLGLLTGTPEMAIPAFIVAGIGGILYYQNMTRNWGSWAYLWTLIPGFSGLGILAAWLLGDRKKQSVRSALDTIATSLVLFVVFGAFFGAFKGLGPYWPVLLIVAGILVGARAFIKGRSDTTLTR